MKRLRSLARRLVGIAKPLMLTLAVAGLIATVRGYSSIRPAKDYTDQGVYTFTAYRVWSTAETRYSGHRQVERIVYKLDYRSPGKQYKYTQDVINKTTGKEYIQEKRQVERRVLSIDGENKYITVEPRYTPQSYVRSLQVRHMVVFGASAGYLTLYGVWVIWQKRAEEERRLTAEY